MSDTPRTDALMTDRETLAVFHGFEDLACLSRRLERENAALNWRYEAPKIPPFHHLRGLVVLSWGRVTLGRFECNSVGEGYWIDEAQQCGDEGWPDVVDVQCWMPLPDAPAKERAA